MKNAGKPAVWTSRQDMLTENFEIFHYRDAYRREVELHHHDFYELYFLVSGKVRYTVEGACYELEPGDVLLISPDELHQPAVDAGEVYERLVLWINKSWLGAMHGGRLEKVFRDFRSARRNLLRLESEQRDGIKSLMLRMYGESAAGDEYTRILCHGLFEQLMAELNRIAAAAPDSAGSEGIMPRIIEYIDLHHAENLSLDALSGMFFISKYHMSREFARHFGITMHRYIIKRRLVAAKGLIMAGQPPTEVYSRCGFGEYATFYRAFRREYGMTPREFADYAGTLAAEK